MSHSVTNLVRDHYARRSLSDDDLARLRGCMLDAAPPASRRGDRRVLQRIALAAAVLLVMMAIGVVVGTHVSTSEQRATRTAQLHAYIADHHRLDLPTNVQAESIPALAQPMPRLDFTPERPTREPWNKCELAGARYCAVEDNIAVQMRMLDAAGARVTIYECKAPGDLREPTRSIVDGIVVETWCEGDLFYAVAYAEGSHP